LDYQNLEVQKREEIENLQKKIKDLEHHLTDQLGGKDQALNTMGRL
jgi:hypothetical protein